MGPCVPCTSETPEEEKHNIVSLDVSDNALGDEGGAGGVAEFLAWKIR